MNSRNRFWMLLLHTHLFNETQFMFDHNDIFVVFIERELFNQTWTASVWSRANADWAMSSSTTAATSGVEYTLSRNIWYRFSVEREPAHAFSTIKNCFYDFAAVFFCFRFSPFSSQLPNLSSFHLVLKIPFWCSSYRIAALSQRTNNNLLLFGRLFHCIFFSFFHFCFCIFAISSGSSSQNYGESMKAVSCCCSTLHFVQNLNPKDVLSSSVDDKKMI